jgi:predicted Zn-dependent protease
MEKRTMTVDEAINIARGIGKITDEARPTVPEAIGIIEEQLHICGFNWITGQAAREVLRNAVTPTNRLGQEYSTKGMS